MSLSQQILAALADAPGFEESGFCKVHETGEQVVSVRLNPVKYRPNGALGFHLGERVPWSSNGFYLSERPIFTFEPLLHAGAFYVQEASSMFLEQALRQTVDLSSPQVVLDLCAAPGGKSTHLLSLLSEDSVVVSNEVIRSRASILEENLIKWGSANSIVTSNDPRDFSGIGPVFDVIVIDAPCSGSGMFRKDPASVEGWSDDLVNLCSRRQQRILADAWPALRENGVLLYSTCSYSVAEDEAIADFICSSLGADSLPVQTVTDWNIVNSASAQTNAAGYRFYPDKIRGEGFYLAAFRKKVAAEPAPRNKSKPSWEAVPGKIQPGIRSWLHEADVELISSNDNILALPPATLNCLQQLKSLYIRKAGITLGKWSGKDLIPDHALAMSHLLATDTPSFAVNLEQALRFLRKEEVDAGDTPRGWALVKYMGYPLGWIKQLGNRSNNYYPREWRILKPA